MKLRQVFQCRGVCVLRVIVALSLTVPLLKAVWGAESPEPVKARRISEQPQTHRIYQKDYHNLPVAGGPQDRQSGLIPAQPADQSAIRDNDIVRAGLNNVTNGPGLKFAATSFDLQHNDAVPHMCGTMGSGAGGQYVHFTWMHWDVICEGGDCIGRFINFSTYNSVTGQFVHGANGVTISGAGCDPLKAWAGFSTLDVDDNNRARIVAQQRDCPEQPSGDYCSYFWAQAAPQFAVFTETVLNGSKGVIGNIADDMLWPHISVDRQAGPDYYHVVAHTNSANNNVVYWRYNGTAWQGPYVVDSTPCYSYNVACDPTSAKAALILLNDDASPVNPHQILQVAYRESNLNGDDWGPVNTTGLGDSKRVFITNYNNLSGPGAWTEAVGDYDNAGDLHVVWVEQRFVAIGDQAALKHWHKASNTISTIHTAYWDNKGLPGARDLNLAFPSLGFGDGSTVCGAGTNLNYIYMTFVQFGGVSPAEQADASASGYQNGDVYLSVSNDGGNHWSPAKDLTNTHRPGCDPSRADSCPSENFPSLARTVNDTLHLMYIDDKDAGDASFGQGSAWTFNPVMYYRIPGGTNVQPVCPQIEPNVSIVLSDANGDCEYNTPPNTSLQESLRLSNIGNATMTGAITATYLNPPTGTWLQLTTGTYTLPVDGADLVFPVTMDAAGLAEGLYKAKISITHNDPTKSSPIEFPVDFFVFQNFACAQYVVLHTNWLELEVSNIERVAVGPNRASGLLRGLYRPPRFGSPDSGNNSIYDASLIIARPPVDITRPPDGVLDSVVYRYLSGTGNYAKGFRALSNLTVDTLRYGTGSGIAYARARQTTVDSIIGVDVEYQFPQSSDSSNFVLLNYRIDNRTASTFSGLIVGEAADLDIVPSTQFWQYQVAHQNTAAFNSGMNLIYQLGSDSGTTSLAKKFLGGMTAIQSSAAPRAWSAPNDPWLFRRLGGGFSEGYLYSQLVKAGFEVIPNPPGTTTLGTDMHSVIAFEKNMTLTPSTVKHYQVAFVTSTAGPSDADLISTTKKAWKFAFGWQDVVALDTLAPNTPASYPYFASGSHEDGPASPCCGCTVSTISGDSLWTIVPDGNNCTGSINFSGVPALGTYTATFRVATPSCGGPTYTDDHVITILVLPAGLCDCSHMGDVANNDNLIDVFDVIQGIAIVFSNAPDIQDEWCLKTRADVNNSGAADVFDIIALINAVFNGGSICNPCNPGVPAGCP